MGALGEQRSLSTTISASCTFIESLLGLMFSVQATTADKRREESNMHGQKKTHLSMDTQIITRTAAVVLKESCE